MGKGSSFLKTLSSLSHPGRSAKAKQRAMHFKIKLARGRFIRTGNDDSRAVQSLFTFSAIH